MTRRCCSTSTATARRRSRSSTGPDVRSTDTSSSAMCPPSNSPSTCPGWPRSSLRRGRRERRARAPVRPDTGDGPFCRFLFKIASNPGTMGAYMSKAARPTLITLALSAAAVLGYVAYRFTFDREPAIDDAPVPIAAAVLVYVASRRTSARRPAIDGLPVPLAPESADRAAPRSLPTALPEFSLANLDGEQQSIRSWPGQPLVINFWATWCAPCLCEI